MDFLRRRVSILVTFPFPESQTAFNSLLLATQRPENNLPKEKCYFTREENIASGEENFVSGRKIILGKFCAVETSYEPGRNTSREENIGGNSFPGRKVICWGKIV